MDRIGNTLNHKISEIEYMRAIAILFTLFHHSVAYLMIQPNKKLSLIYEHFTFWGGVDLFFVISGFVIMKSFSRQLQDSNLQYGSSAKIFWIKRIFRILPPAWIWLAVYLLATQYANYTGAFGEIGQNFKDATAAFLHYANIYGLNCWGEKSNMACGPNGIYWSLSLEEQFYILLPLVIFLFRKHLKWFLIPTLAFQFFLYRPEWTLGWALRTDALIWGVLIAIWSDKVSYKKYAPHFLQKYFILRWVVILLCIFGMAYLPAKPNQIEFGTGLLGLVCALLVWLASYDDGYLFKPIGFIKKIMMWFGTRSYSIYLIHVLVFRWSYEILYQVSETAYRFVSADSFKLLAISLPILLAGAELSYRFIEQPFRKLGLRIVKGSTS